MADELVVPVDPLNEQTVLAAALADKAAREKLLRSVRPDHFLVPQHRPIWQAIGELHRQGLEPDRGALARTGKVDPGYLDAVAALAPSGDAGVLFHLDALLWDKQRALAVEGPLKDLLEALRDMHHAPDRVRAHARRTAEMLSGHGSGRYLVDGDALVAAQLAEIRERAAGRRRYPFGVPSLDYFEDGSPRLLAGAAPGMITVLTGLSGSGKSSVVAHLALGLAKQRRRVLFAAWEPGEGMTLELLACISLGMSRTSLLAGNVDEEGLARLERRMRALSQWVTFMENPFYRRDHGGKPTNERNLDIVEEHIAAARADVFIADLWERCLESDDPGPEKRALFRQQAMCKDLAVHGILLAQQRKDVEQRADKRPTREGIKGSGAWFEVADNLLGTHRPALWKNVEDTTVEIAILKQRWGRWPLCVEFDWDAEMGSIANGRSVAFDHAGEANEFDAGVARAKMPSMRPTNVNRGRR